MKATLHANDTKVIPSETKSLLKNGKVSIKKMPDGKFYELYQDYICGCVFRIARELFALLPIEMVMVNVFGSILNTKTGYLEEKTILTAAIPRKTLLLLNFQSIDPWDALMEKRKQI